VPFAQALLVGAENQRHMGELRHGAPERVEEQHVLRRVRDVIVAPDDVRDRHVDVVGDDRQVVGGLAIRSQDDEVLDIDVLEGYRTVDEIRERRPAVRDLEAHRARRTRFVEAGDIRRRQGTAGAIVDPPAARCFGGSPLRLDLFLGAVAVVRTAVAYKLCGKDAVPVEALRLEVRAVRSADVGALIPIEPEPAQPVDDARHHLPGRALRIGIFDAQDEGPAVAPREQRVEERRSGAAHVEVASWRRGETDADHF
jgi:hypothetical protein